MSSSLPSTSASTPVSALATASTSSEPPPFPSSQETSPPLLPPPPPPSSTTTDAPPTYAPTQPQILVAPLPDSPSFFWGQTVQGEIFVKGLGEGGNRGVISLSVQLSVVESLPGLQPMHLEPFDVYHIWPETVSTSDSNATTHNTLTPTPFHSTHRFCIPLPSSLSRIQPQPLPGTLDLSLFSRGEIRWSLSVHLALTSGDIVTETVRVEGTPQELGDIGEMAKEVEDVLDRAGVRVRLLLDKDKPRLGELLRAGVEVKPKEREKVGLAGLLAQPDPAETLRPLRRVRVELFRRIDFISSQPTSSASSSTSTTIQEIPPLFTLLHTSGKSLRYPGPGHPPLRVLFTLRTAGQGTGGGADPTWGEITSNTLYHRISFFVRVTLGFGATIDTLSNHDMVLGGGGSGCSGSSTAGPSGAGAGVASGSSGITGTGPGRDWVIEKEITIRPKLWIEPTEVFIQGGLEPESSMAIDGDGEILDDERAAYRLKGRDVVGEQGTFRAYHGDDGVGLPPPPPFADEDGAGPSYSRDTDDGIPSNLINATVASTTAPKTTGTTTTTTTTATTSAMTISTNYAASEPPVHAQGTLTDQMPRTSVPNTEVDALPSFIESQAQMRSGHVPPVSNAIMSTRLTPNIGEAFERGTSGTPALSGELGTWVEYDGYETFSVAPPPAAASYGVDSIMDPPREGEGDEDQRNVVGGMVARLGLTTGSERVEAGDLMAQLGLGQGSRVIDLQDDLPPGIDEPSLPALPGFNKHTYRQSLFSLTSSSRPDLDSSGGPPRIPGTPPLSDSNDFSTSSPAPMSRSLMLNNEGEIEDGHDHHHLHHHHHHHELGDLGGDGAEAGLDRPPSFDASEAAVAAGGVARSRAASTQGQCLNHGHGVVTAGFGHGSYGHGQIGQNQTTISVPESESGDAPPGYFGAGVGPPAYS